MSTNSSSHSLLGLPVEVLMCILDHAELCDLYWLSQTCKSMRRLAKRDFRTMVSNNAEDKAEFLLGLAYVLPDHYFCMKCCMLHIFDRHHTSMMPPHCQDQSVNHRRIYVTGYDLQYQHVQLALKYNRLGESYRDALASLMRTHYESCSRGPLGPDIHFSATPEIKNGHFLLHEEWILKAHCNLPCYFMGVSVPICNHIDLFGCRPRNNLLQEFRGATWCLMRHATLLENQEMEGSRHGSCKTCSTSFVFSVPREKKVVLNTTHDYGSFHSLDEWKRRS
ncbi:hypothetical protein FPCIR_8410 [Fusarium pseudocircinatum]|uniref:F-box domain-containing protein n=1 Tax=Fusarium pseudocircinatum TaxID=56676 RepID=A0A8H5L4Q9_9HYPO|nr:hypothetical protein FPCIR_8410 [Fusarium pseudocircinatum]